MKSTAKQTYTTVDGHMSTMTFSTKPSNAMLNLLHDGMKLKKNNPLLYNTVFY